MRADHAVTAERGDHRNHGGEQQQPDHDTGANFGRRARQTEFGDRPPFDEATEERVKANEDYCDAGTDD